MTKKIKLTQGKFAIVDDEVFDLLNQYRWCVRHDRSGNWYAVRKEGGKNIRMHRKILNPQPGFDTDHKNGNGLDNRKENLRQATRSMNIANSVISSKNTSGFKGVYWSSNRGKWRARICKDYKKYCAGFFDNPILASKAYAKKAKELFGEFARF